MRCLLTLGVPHHGGVLLLVVGQAPDESLHVKRVQLAVRLLFSGRPVEVLAVGVEQTGQTADKCCPDAVGMERLGTYYRHESETTVVGDAVAPAALVEAVSLGPFLANSARRVEFGGRPVKAVALHPDGVLGVPHRLNHHVGHNGRRSNG